MRQRSGFLIAGVYDSYDEAEYQRSRCHQPAQVLSPRLLLLMRHLVDLDRREIIRQESLQQYEVN